MKKQITYLQLHKIYITIPKCPNEETLDQSKTKHQPSKLQTTSPCLMSDLQLLSYLLAATNYFLLGWFRSLLAAFLNRYPTALASGTSWGLQGSFNFIPSYSGVWYPHVVWPSPKGVGHFSRSALCSTLVDFTSLLLLFLVMILWYWHLECTRVFHCKRASPIATHRLSSWC